MGAREATERPGTQPDALWGVGRLGPLEEGVSRAAWRVPTLSFLPALFMCHVCEEFYSLSCFSPNNCDTEETFCVTVIVSKLR